MTPAGGRRPPADLPVRARTLVEGRQPPITGSGAALRL